MSELPISFFGEKKLFRSPLQGHINFSRKVNRQKDIKVYQFKQEDYQGSII